MPLHGVGSTPKRRKSWCTTESLNAAVQYHSISVNTDSMSQPETKKQASGDITDRLAYSYKEGDRTGVLPRSGGRADMTDARGLERFWYIFWVGGSLCGLQDGWLPRFY